MRAGLTDADGYLEEWRHQKRPCGDDLEAEVASEVARLEEAYDSSTIRALVRSGGVAEQADPATA